MAKDKRSSLNPFTGKSHFDIVNDDKFLEDSYRQYYAMVQKAQVLDNAPEGQLVSKRLKYWIMLLKVNW